MLVHAVEQHDAVIDHDAHQDQQADLRHHVERGVGGQQHPGSSRQREEDREQDREGLRQRFEQRGHDQVDQHDRQQEVHAHLRVLVVLLENAIVPGPGVARRHVQRVHQFRDRLAGSVPLLALVGCIDRNADLAVLTNEPFGPLHDLEARDVAEHHRASLADAEL